MKACYFDSLQLRPIAEEKSSLKSETQFEWSTIAEMNLSKDERVIFEYEPKILSSKRLKLKSSKEYNKEVYFVLNANIYSIR